MLCHLGSRLSLSDTVSARDAGVTAGTLTLAESLKHYLLVRMFKHAWLRTMPLWEHFNKV